MSEHLRALRSSVERLRSVAGQLNPADFESPAHPSEWTIADTFSHLGSSGQILQRMFEDAIEHRDADPAFNAAVWDEWNTKEPSLQVTAALDADAALLERLEEASEEERATVHIILGPMTLDFDRLIGIRLSEHVLHTWDIEVALDPTATLDNDAANLILDSIHSVVQFTGRASGKEETLRVRTTEAAREFSLVFTVDSVSLNDATHPGPVDLEIPAETFVRLIYGRLDADHTPSVVDAYEIDSLRRAFPGI
jgi:uncharacterized protein (TIGR03083 family)